MRPGYLEFSIDWGDQETVAAYDELPLWSAMAGLLLLRHVPLRPGMTVLDVGPGTGFPLLELAQRFGPASRVMGVDRWWTALSGRAAVKRRAWGVRNAHLVLGDAAALPLPTARFDLVVSNLGLNNFDDPAASIAECSRVLRPDGRIAITTNLQGHMAEFYEAFKATLRALGRDNEIDDLRRHIDHRATADGVQRLFEGAGLQVKRVELDEAVMRFADGSALLRHHFIKLGFLDAWKAVVAESARAMVFEALERRLNDIARAHGELSLTIPLAYIEGAPA